MAGFGVGQFGYGPFGRADWSKLAIHNKLPVGLRRLDEEADGYFMSILDSMKPSFDHMLTNIRSFSDLRHPGYVRSRFSTVKTVTVSYLESILDEGDGWGDYVSIHCTGSIGDIGADWECEADDGIHFNVIRVNKNTNRIDISGRIRPVATMLTFNAPEQLTSLYKDYGLYADRYFNDTLLRGEVEHAVTWLSLKGSVDGYVYRGKISGFDVTVNPVWRISDEWVGLLDLTQRFEYPRESGIHYTTVAPYWVLYDDMAGDIITGDTLAVLMEESMDFSYVISAVSLDTPLTSTATHTITISTDVVELSRAGNWKLIDVAENEFWIESRIDATHFTVIGSIPPSTGNCILRYVPPLMEDSSWIKTNLLAVEIQKNDTFQTITADDGDITARLIEKLNDVKPAHVKFVAILERHSGDTSNPVVVSGESSESSESMAGWRVFDAMPGDYEAADRDPIVTVE